VEQLLNPATIVAATVLLLAGVAVMSRDHGRRQRARELLVLLLTRPVRHDAAPHDAVVPSEEKAPGAADTREFADDSGDREDRSL